MTASRIRANHGIKPYRLEGYLASNDPNFETEAAVEGKSGREPSRGKKTASRSSPSRLELQVPDQNFAVALRKKNRPSVS